MNPRPIRVLGIDTALRSTGIAVVAAQGTAMSAVEYGRLRFPAGAPLSECLKGLAEGVCALIERSAPEAAAVEGGFFFKNARTALLLGEARGAVVAACALKGVPVYEYAPRRIKQAVAGFGGAEKEQVRAMVMSLLALKAEPQEDESDALAIAICHLHSRTGHAALMPKPI